MTQDLRIPSISRGPKIKVFVNGQGLVAYHGETVLAALIAAGRRVLRKSRIDGENRGPLCGMGVCYECLVSVNGSPNRRACMTDVEDHMEIGIDDSEDM
ncbi:MAG: (2Fe-2S)-binding protein [Deltaproteobacteria bacterium]|nr:(2Fe-2S)-binding protein [Deltaproteobacteria bacterium]